jgi:uncharacterized protein YxeA
MTKVIIIIIIIIIVVVVVICVFTFFVSNYDESKGWVAVQFYIAPAGAKLASCSSYK